MQKKLLAQINFPTIYDTLRKAPYNIDIKLPSGGKIGTRTLLENAKLGDIISAFLPYIYVIAGLILFGLLVIGGFGLLTSAGNPDSVKKAQSKIVSALTGFVIIFISYWLAQILEIIFKIQIL